MNHRPKWKCKVIKFAEDNGRENLGDLGSGGDFLDIPPKAGFMVKVKLEYIKI